MTWIIRKLLPSRLPGVRIPEAADLEELEELEVAMTNWSEQLKAEGLAEGRAEGRVGTLVSIARRRFGEAAASTMAALLGSDRSEAALEEIEGYLLTCDNGDALIAKIRQI